MDFRIVIVGQESTITDLTGRASDLVTAIHVGPITRRANLNIIIGERSTNETTSSTVKVTEVPIQSRVFVLVDSVLELQDTLVESCDFGDLDAGTVAVGDQAEINLATAAVSSCNDEWCGARLVRADTVGSRITSSIVTLVDIYRLITPS